jgi:hypothetical protein
VFLLNDAIFNIDVGKERLVVINDFAAFDEQSRLGALNTHARTQYTNPYKVDHNIGQGNGGQNSA